MMKLNGGKYPTKKTTKITNIQAPSGYFDTFLPALEETLSSIGVDKDIVVAGDFNVHFSTLEPEANQLCDILGSFGLKQTIYEPTREQACLDNVFVSSGMDVCASDVVDMHISDNKALVVEVCIKANKPEHKITKKAFTAPGVCCCQSSLNNEETKGVDTSSGQAHGIPSGNCKESVIVVNLADHLGQTLDFEVEWCPTKNDNSNQNNKINFSNASASNMQNLWYHVSKEDIAAVYQLHDVVDAYNAVTRLLNYYVDITCPIITSICLSLNE
nr:unnamed protein product [Callosobruchus analis]